MIIPHFQEIVKVIKRVILGSISHVIKPKNHNHSIYKFKNLGYDRWSLYKQPRQESGLCCFSFTRYSQKCATQIYRALYREAMFVPLGGAQTWRP